jgi:hypothetical protein
VGHVLVAMWFVFFDPKWVVVHGVMKDISVNKLTSTGCNVKIWVCLILRFFFFFFGGGGGGGGVSLLLLHQFVVKTCDGICIVALD